MLSLLSLTRRESSFCGLFYIFILYSAIDSNNCATGPPLHRESGRLEQLPSGPKQPRLWQLLGTACPPTEAAAASAPTPPPRRTSEPAPRRHPPLRPPPPRRPRPPQCTAAATPPRLRTRARSASAPPPLRAVPPPPPRRRQTRLQARRDPQPPRPPRPRVPLPQTPARAPAPQHPTGIRRLPAAPPPSAAPPGAPPPPPTAAAASSRRRGGRGLRLPAPATAATARRRCAACVRVAGFRGRAVGAAAAAAGLRQSLVPVSPQMRAGEAVMGGVVLVLLRCFRVSDVWRHTIAQ